MDAEVDTLDLDLATRRPIVYFPQNTTFLLATHSSSNSGQRDDHESDKSMT